MGQKTYAQMFDAKLTAIQEKREILDEEESALVEESLQFCADAWNHRFPEGSEQREYNDGEAVDAKDLSMPLTWTCGEDDCKDDPTPEIEKSPTGYCVYNSRKDPAHDSCIFCGSPEERK